MIALDIIVQLGTGAEHLILSYSKAHLPGMRNGTALGFESRSVGGSPGLSYVQGIGVPGQSNST